MEKRRFEPLDRLRQTSALVLVCAWGLALCGCSRKRSSLSELAPSETQPESAVPGLASPGQPATVLLDATGDSAEPSSQRDAVATDIGLAEIRPIYHASLLIQFNHKNIYIDPTSEGNYRGLPKADYIFVTHSHPDHFDAQQIEALMSNSTTTIVGPPAVASRLKDVQVMRNHENHAFPEFSVAAVPAYNLRRGPAPGKLYHPKGEGNGYVFTFANKRAYISGDTECTPDMKALSTIDVAFICMRLPYTMPPKEAAECIRAFQPRIVYPYHYQGSRLEELTSALADFPTTDIRLRDWYRKP